MKLTILAAVISATVSLPLYGQTERDLDSHEHGSALLNVAIEGNTLFFELDSPWNNLVGFEHAPRTEEQHDLVDDAITQLKDANSLFAFSGANCTVVEFSIESSLSEGEHDDEHHDDEHHDDEHHDDEHHDDEHHDDEHHDDEHHDDHEGETHSEVRASYSFECDDTSKLATIDVKVLSVWSGFEELDVQLIGPSGQAGAELTPSSTILDVSSIR